MLQIGSVESYADGEGLLDGTRVVAPFGREGQQLVVPAHANYQTGTIESRIWSASTAVAGVGPGTSLSTTAAFWLSNPRGSRVVLSILRSSVGYVSGTIGVGQIYYTTFAGAPTAIATGTAIVSRNRLIGGDAVPCALAFTTATVPTQVALRPVWPLFPFLATSVLGIQGAVDEPNGDILVAPGYGVGLNAVAAAGVTPRVVFSMTWEEIPVTGLGV